MAQFYGTHEIVAKYRGTRLIDATVRVTEGKEKVLFSSVSSCFGSGAWRNDKPWVNKETWKN